MTLRDFNSIIDNLLVNSIVSVSLESRIQIKHDVVNRNIVLLIPVFKSFGNIPKSIEDYVTKRASYSFKPHSTFFRNSGDEILLIQEISFDWGFQDSYRQHVVQFWALAKHCHRMLKEIALEEGLKKIDPFCSHFEE